ncbi:Single-stranded-DNA-specific exonuclease recJ [Rickettsiales bacterium Ac37b]|nr:Single-stranded-DNA-specific exonuclease recJ [Rickettsiales bacterium Ac37b]
MQEKIKNHLYYSIRGHYWCLKDVDERNCSYIQQKYNIPAMIAELLINRGVKLDQVNDYLNPTLRAFLPNPMILLDMEKAANRIVEAIEYNHKIVIFGDYDVDGATSSALLKRFFSAISFHNHTIYIPDRFTEGYGPNLQAFEQMLDEKVKLVITVDCGTAAIDTINKITDKGLEIIVVDHHLGGEILPRAVAIVNPNRYDETSKYGYLAAVGVTFLLVVAITSILRQKGWFKVVSEPDLLSFLDIVALGTVCDVVPLIELNRAFVKQGLKVMSKRNNIGLTSLIDLAGINEELNIYHLGYVIGPRINAGGRIGKSWLGAKLLANDDFNEANDIAKTLNHLNQERRAIETMTLEEAFVLAEQSLSELPFVYITGNKWHQGVIGIVASRLKDKYDKVVIVISVENNIGKASCRSIVGIDIGALIINAKNLGLVIEGGGHAMAAGFTIMLDKVILLKQFLNEQLQDIPALLEYDCRTRYFEGFLSLEAITLELAKLLDKLEPYGASNPAPKFLVKNSKLIKINVIAGKHISCLFKTQSSTGVIKGIIFNAVNTLIGNFLLSSLGRDLDIIGQLQISKWQGNERVELIISDVIK